MSRSEPPPGLAAIRGRAQMWVGSTGLLGLIHYLVCPVALLLAHGATRIDVSVSGDFEVTSDAVLPLERTDNGLIAPFQIIRPWGEGHSYEATVLTALSQYLSVPVSTGSQREEAEFLQGILASHESTEANGAPPGTALRFKPDSTIFTVTEVSQAIFESYFCRLSYLHDGVHFSLTVGGHRQEYCNENGVAALFTAVSSPYQLMHEPVAIASREGSLELKMVMAYHSWTTNHLLCFINNGRATEGGTHERGLVQGLKLLQRTLGLPENFKNGVVAVVSIRYPGAVFEGCIKARIGNPELKHMVSRMIVREVGQWLNNHLVVKEQLTQLRTFPFPEAWSNKPG